MKFTSWVNSKKRGGCAKFLLLLLALVCGILLALEMRFAVFRIHSIETVPANILPNSAIWGTVASAQEKFWPTFFFARREYTATINKYYPVNAKLKLVGWGRFVLSAEPLKPFIRVYWGGKYWYLNEDGRFWLTSMEENNYIDNSEARANPLLSWGSNRTTPVELATAEGNIYTSSLPVTDINRWLGNIKALGWNGKIKFIEAVVIAEQSVIKLTVEKNDGSDGVTIIFPNNPDKWLEPGIALNKIYPEIRNISENIFIDTTYNNKILVKNKVQ